MKKSHIAILFFIAVCIAFMATKIGKFSSFVTFDEARANEGTKLKIAGNLVKDKGVIYDPELDPNSFSFFMVDKEGNESRVVCFDEKPRDFELSDEVVLTGEMKGDAFYAYHLLVKCPSKYTDEEIAKS